MIRKIINIGIVKNLPTKEIKRIRVLNFTCVFCIVDLLFFIILRLLLNALSFSIGLAFLVEMLVFVVIIFLQYKREYFIARVVFFIAFACILFYHCNFLIKGNYSEYYYLILPIASLFFFDKNIHHYTSLLLCLVLFFVPNYFFKVYEEGDFGYFHTAIFFLGIFLAIRYFKIENQRNEEELFRINELVLEQKEALEKAYEELEQRKQAELAHFQLKSLKAQMNPHFMFNAMNSIQNLVLKGGKHEAYNYLTKFSSLIRENLNMSEKSFVSFEEELSLLEKYLELEKLRFRKDFEYSIQGMERINDIKVPSMIIQPFVENSIKHGLLHKLNGVKMVKITFDIDEVFKCVIEDNGIGVKASKEINLKNRNQNNSFSTNAIKDRLSLLKDYYKTDIGFHYEQVKEGTKVIIKIPYINSDE
ncbi:histidine kinase [uncultured Tenacibaculum sp.]|uniref:sensor histidine kinase n=1 Tax=uncultured Tenacibaculum sp. TaxID=174713 RepID=UPI00263411F2|nr:histidine kinase [uncultured Tenacibaculum sp.]